MVTTAQGCVHTDRPQRFVSRHTAKLRRLIHNSYAAWGLSGSRRFLVNLWAEEPLSFSQRASMSSSTPPSNLRRFCQLLDNDVSLQEQVQSAVTPDTLLTLAASAGFPVTASELRSWSGQLSAPYFPWAGKGTAWRRSFFDQQAEITA